MNGIGARWTLLAALALAATLASGCNGCAKDEPKPTAAAPQGPAVSGTVTINLAPPGASALPPMVPGSLYKRFPKDGDGGYKRIFSSEKEGFAEAKLEKDGKEVAILNILDAERLAYTKARFDGATEKVGESPVVTIGDDQTCALVKGRFQVKVTSKTLKHEARKAILASFDLNGLGT